MPPPSCVRAPLWFRAHGRLGEFAWNLVVVSQQVGSHGHPAVMAVTGLLGASAISTPNQWTNRCWHID